ncbi:sn-glycerol-3-phosphate ABC transporter ATP-binding protein UgpC [Marivibrio halodurans]|uniref:sn-glycerol-3-phosphate ABC transporter ATP-binding protein UgpC n=1 Tax=Marivibrio halodurans TaxID=2039722 RepID=A0A8J7S674_9PROT|nr:sn-glycerol-3-phosphate ABC transporter ATP-binding protein UgpC [Marivibrio halodurans]MBP5857484.1 sn-glycerol-3-phosphate ABC transporter ATP-binding protein UgpC [Marivibrio halodurans]
MASIEIRNVTKKFGDLTVVDDVSMSIDDGELMVFVGPSGCGKSTTLRMVAGLETTTAGTIMIGDRDVTRLDPKDRNIAMVFQNYALYAHKSVYGNLAFGLRMRGASKAEIDKRVREAAATLGIDDLLERRPKQLSGGQRQRVALGRALVRDPDAFLLDEPLSNLDAKLRVRMREEIGSLHSRIGTSMIYVTHDQVEAMTLGNRIAVMKDGRLQQVGAPLEVYDNPANQFVASFIGSPEMNQVDARLEAAGSGLRLMGDGFAIDLSTARSAGLSAGADVVLGLRPEHLEVLPDGAEDGVEFRMRVDLVEPMGAQTLLLCREGGTSLRVLISRNDGISRGDRVAMRLGDGRYHLFDAASGTTLKSIGTKVI